MPSNESVNLKNLVACFVVAIALGGVASCSDSAPNSTSNDNSGDSATEAKPTARSSKTKKDRGNAQFNLAGTTWNGSRATARIKNGNLKITASYSTRDGDTMKRDSLNINIIDYQGPGTYKANMTSMLVRVSIDVPKDDGNEADATKMLADALGDLGHVRLANADVEVTSASGGFVDGRFSLAMPGMPDKAVTDGQFHARIRE